MFSPVQKCTYTGIYFGPNCVVRCFLHNIFSSTDDKKCSHTWTTVDLSEVISRWTQTWSLWLHNFLHQTMTPLQTIQVDTWRWKIHERCEQWDVDNFYLTRLRQDVLLMWDVSYPLSEFPLCKSFGGVWINTEFNRQIHRSKFGRVPHWARLVRAFEEEYNSLSIDLVWLICKSQSEEGF